MASVMTRDPWYPWCADDLDRELWETLKERRREDEMARQMSKLARQMSKLRLTEYVPISSGSLLDGTFKLLNEREPTMAINKPPHDKHSHTLPELKASHETFKEMTTPPHAPATAKTQAPSQLHSSGLPATPSRQVPTEALNEELAKIEADAKVVADPNMPEVTVRAAASKIAGNVTRIRAILKGE